MESTVEKMEFRKVKLSPFHAICLTHYGSYDSPSINENWDKLLAYAFKNNLLTEHSQFFGEILDDNEVTKDENCRYIGGITLPENLNFEPEGFFQIKNFEGGNYAVFQYRGDRKKIESFYELIFVRWITINDFEIIDQPIMEFYLNDKEDTPIEDLLTDIYIPIE